MSQTCLGYQISSNQFDSDVVNNAGDPFGNRTAFYMNTSHDEERSLIKWYYQQVLCIKERMWGYVATGSTEAILCGLWMARKTLSNSAIVFASKDCHFCVPKVADILGLEFIPIKTKKNGEMCMQTLLQEVQTHDREAIVVLTMGTTVRNAYDNVLEFKRLKFDKRVHVHVDAAFGGAIYPFTNPEMLTLSFDTYNVSLHKFWGAPRPCAIFLCTKKLQTDIDGNGTYGKELGYIASTDHTISCSRDGAIIKQMLEYFTRRGFASRNLCHIKHCISLRERYVNEFKTLLGDHRVQVANTDLSLSFTLLDLPIRMEQELHKFSMSIRLRPCGKRFDTHVYVSLHVTSELLNDLLKTMIPYIEEDSKAHPQNGCLIA